MVRFVTGKLDDERIMFPQPQLLTSYPGILYPIPNLTVNDVGVGTIRRAGIRVGTDGRMYAYRTDTGWEDAGQWISPLSAYDPLYEVTIQSVVFLEGFTFYTKAADEGVRVDLSAVRDWEVRDSISSAAGNVHVQFQLWLRYNGGPVLKTASMELLALWDIS